MPINDAATVFTLEYLKLLERHLKVTWNDDGDPVCIIDWFGEESITNLREDLQRLIESDLEPGARRATIEYGKEHVQTVGFGLAPDFKQFVNLGLIYGDRVVLWDLIASRLLVSVQPNLAGKSLLAQVACNLLTLRPVIERGGIVILAHPIAWSRQAAEIDVELRATGSVPAASLGLSLAFAAIEEGLPLHPYTLLESGSKPTSTPSDRGREDELFSAENYRFQQCLTTLLKDARVAFLEDVRVEDFFNVVSGNTKLRRALRTHFAQSLSGLSQRQAETQDLVDEFFELFEKQNVAVTDFAAEGVDATANFLLATVSSGALGMSLLGALAALGAPAVHLSTAIRKWSKKPEKNVIIQAFRALEKASDEAKPHVLLDMEQQLSNYRRGEQDLGNLYRTFMSFSWTENKHAFLQTLSPEVAKALLASLSQEDLQEIVNHRRFQEDYIGDYLAYLSELDEAIYWAHLGKTFESPEGLLIYDDDAHIISMETRDMPLATWGRLLHSLFDAYAGEMRSRVYDFPLERFPKIIRFQTNGGRDSDAKRAALNSLSSSLGQEDRAALRHLVVMGFEGVAPEWLT